MKKDEFIISEAQARAFAKAILPSIREYYKSEKGRNKYEKIKSANKKDQEIKL